MSDALCEQEATSTKTPTYGIPTRPSPKFSDPDMQQVARIFEHLDQNLCMSFVFVRSNEVNAALEASSKCETSDDLWA